MSFVAELIIKGAASGVASSLFGKFADSVFGGENAGIKAQLDNIMGQMKLLENRLIDGVTLVSDKSVYRDKIGQIQEWTDTLKKYTNIKSTSGNTKGWDDFAESLHRDQHSAHGINMLLSSVNTILVENDTAQTAGLLQVFETELRGNLASTDPKCDIQWYLERIDRFLAAAIRAQLCGLTLQIFMTVREAKEERQFIVKGFEQEMWERIRAQVKFTYESMHPTVQTLKKDYLTPIDLAQWWIIRDAAGQRIFTMADTAINLTHGNNDASSVWRLIPSGNDVGRVWVRNGRNNHNLRAAWWEEDRNIFKKGYHTYFGCCEGPAPALHSMPSTTHHVGEEVLKVKVAPTKEGSGFRFMRPSDGFVDHWFWQREFFFFRAEASVMSRDVGRPPIYQLEGKLIMGDTEEDHAVYLVLDGRLRLISSPSIADGLFGPNWHCERLLRSYVQELIKTRLSERFDEHAKAKLVSPNLGKDIYLVANGWRWYIPSRAILAKYGFKFELFWEIGRELYMYHELPALGHDMRLYEGKRLKGSGPAIYLVLNWRLRLIASWEVYEGLFGGNDDVWVEPQGVIDTYPKGSPLTANPPLIEWGNRIYLMDNNKKRWIDTFETFLFFGFDRARVRAIDAGAIPNGPHIDGNGGTIDSVER